MLWVCRSIDARVLNSACKQSFKAKKNDAGAHVVFFWQFRLLKYYCINWENPTDLKTVCFDEITLNKEGHLQGVPSLYVIFHMLIRGSCTSGSPLTAEDLWFFIK